MRNKTKALRFFSLWGLIFLLCLIVRLPLFFSEWLFVDEDEAIIGLMSIDFLEGELFPYYFYGQHYGLSFFEVIAGALTTLLLGHSVWALKLAALLIFSLGITFILKSFQSRGYNMRVVIIIGVLLAVFPTWYLWGSMLRGGYVTGFTAIATIFYLTTKNNGPGKNSVGIGILIFLTYESHTLFLLPILPLIIYWWFESGKKIVPVLLVALSGLGSILLVKLIYPVLTGANTSSFSLVGMRWENLLTHLKGWMNGFSGYYFFGVNFTIPILWQVGIVVMLILIIIVLCLGLFKLELKKRLVLFLMIIGTFAIFPLISLMDDYTPRYMVSVFTGVLFSLLFVFIHAKSKLEQRLALSLAVISAIGILYSSSTPRHWYHNGQSLLSDLVKVEERVKKEGVKAVIALDGQFLWNYLYGEQIPAANLCWNNRTSEYSLRVKEVFKNNPDDVLLFGFHGVAYDIETQEDFQSEQLTDNYFMMRKVREKDLIKGREVYPCYY